MCHMALGTRNPSKRESSVQMDCSVPHIKFLQNPQFEPFVVH